MTELMSARQIDSAWRRYLRDRSSPVLDMAAGIRGGSKARVKQAVVRLARAQGVDETRARLREVQAECLAWEAQFPEVEDERAA